MVATLKDTNFYRSFRNFRRRFRTKWKQRIAFSKRSKSKANFIAITGSSAKTTTSSLLAHILHSTAAVKDQLEKNGVGATVETLTTLENTDAYVVLEIGTDAPGSIAEAAKFVRPNIAIVTLVALEHYAAFRSLANVVKEKTSLVQALSPSGLAILNKDDPNVRDHRK